MIEWNIANTYLFAALVSSIVLIVSYYLFIKKPKKRR